MFFHNINPVMLDLGSVQIRYYGLVYFVGFLFTYFYFKHLIKKKLLNLEDEKLDLFMIYFMLGSILGARILDFVFFNFNVLLQDPLEIIRIWHGGMSIHGGIIGAMIGSYIFAVRHKIKFYELADFTIIPLMTLLGIGRIANFINGELWGTNSTSSICINYTNSTYIAYAPEGCRHPYVLYESLKNFAVAGILLIIKAKTKLKRGLLFWYGMFMYNFFRFFVDFYRDGGEPRLFLGLTMTQYLCIVFTISSVVMIFVLSRKETNKEIKAENKEAPKITNKKRKRRK
ncbi:MAG: prolipoprotein diacylglyceryl transferase [Candidatus Nanoarchaeia archaeon]